MALFLHIISIATLIGGTSFMVMYLRDTTRCQDQDRMRYALGKVQHWNVFMMTPVSILAALSGFYMLLQYSHKPTWLMLKERLGGLFLLCFILLITVYGRKCVKQEKQSIDISQTQTIIRRYITALNFSILIMILLTFVVTFKF
jgi:protoporphyrinogen IX oxidase